MSVREIKREKIERKELPTFNLQFTKRTIEIVHNAFLFEFLRTRHAETAKTPEKA